LRRDNDKKVPGLQIKQGKGSQIREQVDQTINENKFKISPIKIVNVQSMQAHK
jgi:hypothetical protein